MSDYKPLTCLPVLPLRGIVVFPGCVTHFDVGRSRSARAVEEVFSVETRLAVMSIIVENGEMVERLNALLHEYGEFIIGRMGIPYRKRGVSVIAIAMDAPQNTIAALSGKIGGLVGVSVKTAYSGVISKE